MAIPVLHHNDTRIYNVSGYDSSKLPEWIISRHRRKLKKDPEASNRLLLTRDGQSVIATGTYKPQIRVFDLEHLTLKFDRHTNAENVNFLALSDDWTKLALLQTNRTIELHSQGGIYYCTRIPKAGRDLIYDPFSCDILVASSSNQVYRLNLDQGQFLAPFDTDQPGMNTLALGPQHRLLVFGGEDGTMEYWDPRYKRRVGRVPVPQGQATALRFLPDGLTLACGTSEGVVHLFDLRSAAPLLSKDHQYSCAIKKIEYHEDRGHILSADSRVVKVWDKVSGKILASVLPPSAINDVCLQQGTGLFMLANEGSQMQSFFVPALGPAPRWCSFLDNLTEELEESIQPSIYDNYKFVTRQELDALGLRHLVGTAVLRAYMHGFFIDLRLYEKAKAIANPFAYDEYRRKLAEDKIESEASTRISRKKASALPKVNAALASKLSRSTSSSHHGSLLEDLRFRDLFSNTEFEIDERSLEFKQLHPSHVAKPSEPMEQGVAVAPEDPSSDAASGDDEEFGIRN